MRRTSRRRHAGVGLVELLLALSITAALLTATASAIDASFTAYRVNQEQALLTQRARLGLNRIVQEIRLGVIHRPHGTTYQYLLQHPTTWPAVYQLTDTGIDLVNQSGKTISYYFQPGSNGQPGSLMCDDDGNSSTQARVMIKGVSSFTIAMGFTRVQHGSTYDLLRSATINMTLASTSDNQSGTESTLSQTMPISATVVPRQNVW